MDLSLLFWAQAGHFNKWAFLPHSQVAQEMIAADQ